MKALATLRPVPIKGVGSAISTPKIRPTLEGDDANIRTVFSLGTALAAIFTFTLILPPIRTIFILLRLYIAVAPPVLPSTAVSGGPSFRLPLPPLRLPIRLRGIALICLERVIAANPFLVGVALPADETAVVYLFCGGPHCSRL